MFLNEGSCSIFWAQALSSISSYSLMIEHKIGDMATAWFPTKQARFRLFFLFFIFYNLNPLMHQGSCGMVTVDLMPQS